MMFKSIKCLMSIVIGISLCCPGSIIDIYDLDMVLKIPRVYDNSNSIGYRQLQK